MGTEEQEASASDLWAVQVAILESASARAKGEKVMAELLMAGLWGLLIYAWLSGWIYSPVLLRLSDAFRAWRKPKGAK